MIDNSELQSVAKHIKQTLERQRCASCNNRKAMVTVTMSEHGPRLKIAACCFNFEQKLQIMARDIWDEYKKTKTLKEF